MKMPDFIIVGCMKSGTSALWRNLQQHPDIHMARNPRDPKATGIEIRFWNNAPPTRCWRLGLDWYQDLFLTDKVGGEKCANYIESPKAMGRLHDHLPKVKLIVCIREPVDRVYSEFRMNYSGEDKVRRFPRFADRYGPRVRGQYMYQINRSLLSNGFRRDQMLIVVQERMRLNLQSEMNLIYDWLRVDRLILPARSISSKDRDQPMHGEYRDWRSEYCPLPTDMRASVAEYYEPHNSQLFDFLGFEIPEWRLGIAG